MFKVDRIDTADSFFTKFVVESDNNQFQEFNVPVWDADEFEAKVQGFTNIDFNNFKDKAGKSNARSSQ